MAWAGPQRLRAGYGVGDASPPDAGPLDALVTRLAMNLRQRKPAMAMKIIFRMLCSIRRMEDSSGALMQDL